MCLDDFSVALLSRKFWRIVLSDQTFDVARTDNVAEALYGALAEINAVMT